MRGVSSGPDDPLGAGDERGAGGGRGGRHEAAAGALPGRVFRLAGPGVLGPAGGAADFLRGV